MRILFLTIVMMGGTVIMMQFVLVDTARIHKERSEAKEVERDRVAERYRSKILPHIESDLKAKGSRIVPTGKVAQLESLYGKKPALALRALGGIPHEISVDALWRIYEAEASSERRRDALLQLARTGHPKARTHLKAVSGDPKRPDPERKESRRLLEAF